MGQLPDLARVFGAGKALEAPAVAPLPGMVFGHNGLWTYPPGFLAVSDPGRAFTGNGVANPESSLLSGAAALANVLPAAAGIGDLFDIQLAGTVLNSSGTSTYTLTLKVYHGAYAMFSVTTPNLTSNAAVRLWRANLRVMVEVAGGTGAGKLKIVGQRWGLDTLFAVGAGWQNVPGGVAVINDGVSTGTDANLITNAARDFNVTATHSNNTASMTTTLNEAVVQYSPKYS